MPDQDDRIAVIRAADGLQALEQRFLDWILRFDVPAETPLSVARAGADLRRHPASAERVPGRAQPFGLVARRPKGGWMLRGFTKEFAVELSDFRLVLELDAIAKLVEAPVDHPVWPRLATLRVQHLALADQIDTHFHEFSKLDEAFHEAINAVVRNRFVAEFQKVISLIFHYHYMWDKTQEKQRNGAAIQEHLAIIDALEARDAGRALDAARQHLRTSKSTLLSSLRHHDLG
ncbi:GntR family transcriptional regulator [Paracoccus sp. NBH48]|uniref:GntR family transcriptional regulator n=1 Tax=Paracoccus sp. NBH48 TaxID=2596918 RepID=UPI0019D516ED|nr:GntR family transcriptional regulator [Paracoccus sp. NBH48]